MTAVQNEENQAPTATEVKVKKNNRGRKPSGIVKENICIRSTPEDQEFLKTLGKGSKTRGVDKLIEMYRAGQLQQPVSAEPALASA